MAVRAPELDLPGLVWLNTDAPLGRAALRGRVVILDFWTSCCIHCLHVLPALRQVEERFPHQVAVIGVHSPKFPAEREIGRLRQAIARLDIRHPVVQDTDFQLWKQYAVRAWPTLVFLSADGYVVGQHAGEPDAAKLLAAVGRLVEGTPEAPPELPLQSGIAPEPVSARLRFPGKIRPFRQSDGCELLAVADTGHNRVLLLDAEGNETAAFGSGERGFVDGTAGHARFDAPQAVAATHGRLYVADTGNHAIRCIDLAAGRVGTVAGIGRRGRRLGPAPAPARESALASPWDLAVGNGMLYFANAGTHQLGAIDLGSGMMRRIAGTGAEGLRDGGPEDACLAQPSALALEADGEGIVFADAETSAVRRLHLASGQVSTLVGAGLFEFGRIDGPLASARLQHPLDLTPDGKAILVADSFNDTMRRIDQAADRVEEYGADFRCEDPLCLPLGEPAGLCLWQGAIFLADTGNHRILRYDRAARSYRTWYR
ncbi:MAG: redoxin domain-containing protein [Alphaproteobacteria bacterium]|nr:redoxin domain-containing protein [Alphaproteobacteria bacterium]